MKLGVQTRPWGPEMNRQRLPEVLAEAAAAGYDGVEIGVQHLEIARPQAYRQLLVDHGLEAAAIHVGGDIYQPQAIKEALARLQSTILFAAEAGAPFLAFSGQWKPDKTAEQFSREVDSLNAIGQLCHRSGMRLCYHNHFWEIAGGCHGLQYLCDHTDPALVWLCLDVGWVQRAGGDPAGVVRTFLDRVGYLHLKDTTEDEWAELGQGTVDLPAVLQAIRGRELPWLVVEQDEVWRPPVESARMSRDYLRCHFAI